MPHLTTDQREALTKTAEFQSLKTTLAKGLTIYNIISDCIEFWNGTKWILMCEDCSDDCTPVTDVSIGGMTAYTEGGTISLTANINPANATAITYQWYKDGTAISGATSATY